MMILNKEKRVIVLKAVGLPTLRLFPGHNSVDKKDFEKYIASPAAKGHLKKTLSVVDDSNLTSEDSIQAEISKEKNEMLNKANRIIKSQEKTIKDKKGENKALEKIIKDQAKQLKELTERLEALETKPDEKPDEEPDEK